MANREAEARLALERPCRGRFGLAWSPAGVTTFLLFLALPCLPSCTSDAPRATPTLEISLHAIAEIGPDVHGGQIGTGGFALGPDGSLAVIDPGDRQLVLIRGEGDQATRAGRSGGGPGEFTGPRLVAALDDGGVAIYDRALRRLSFWGPGGELLEERVLPRSVWSMRGEEGSVLLKVGREGVAAEDGGFAILRVGPESQEATLFETSRGAPLDGTVSEGNAVPQICSVCPFFRTGDGEWVLQPGGWADPIVGVNDNGIVATVWSRGREPAPLSDAEWLEERRRLHDEARAMAEDLTPALGAVYPEFNPRTTGDPPLRRILSQRGAFGVDGQDRVWTLPSLSPDSLPRLEVHGRDGTFLGDVELEGRPVRLDVRGAWIALVVEDDLGLATIRLFRIVED